MIGAVRYGLARIEFLCQIGSFDNKMALLLQVVLCARMRGRLKLHHSSSALLGSWKGSIKVHLWFIRASADTYANYIEKYSFRESLVVLFLYLKIYVTISFLWNKKILMMVYKNTNSINKRCKKYYVINFNIDLMQELPWRYIKKYFFEKI